MGGLAKDWLLNGGSIPDKRELRNDLTAIDSYQNRGRLQLELKKYIKKKLGGRSPDDGDAFFLTFAMPLKDDIDFNRKRTPAQIIMDQVTGRSQNTSTYIPGLNMMQ